MKSSAKDRAAMFGLLASPIRLGILNGLVKGPQNVGGLCKALGQKQPTVSHHLGLLRTARLVAGKRQGKAVFYTSDKAVLKDVASCLAGLMQK